MGVELPRCECGAVIDLSVHGGRYWCSRCLWSEVKQLRKLVRCEQIKPPADVADDMTTEFAVELAEAKVEIEQLQAIIIAKNNLIGWYEEDHGRFCYDDEDMPDDLRKLEELITAAEAGGNDE